MQSRKYRTLYALTALCLLLASCYWQAGVPTGTISFSFSSRPGARYLDPFADTLRVYLMAGNDLVRIGPAAHPYWDELELSGGASSADYTSPEIPAGIAYTVMVAAGESMEGDFWPLNHGMAEGVSVTQGASTAVSITLENVPNIVQSPIWGENATGMVMDFNMGSAYASTEHSLYTFLFPFAEFVSLAQVNDAAINSLSMSETFDGEGYPPGPWLNTERGILPYDLYDRNPSGDFAVGYGSGDGARNVFRSAMLTYPDFSTSKYAVYLRASGLGAALIPEYDLEDWIDADFSQYEGGTKMYDLAVSSGQYSSLGFAYVATSAGAFRIPATAFVAGATASSIISASTPFNAGTGSSRILSLASVLDGSGERDLLYMGTAEGVYCAVLNYESGPVFSESPVLVYQNAGRRVRMLKCYDLSGAGDTTRIAFIDGTGITIVDHLLSGPISGSTTQFYSRLPFYAGLPSDYPEDLHQMDWYDTGSGFLHLIIAGKKGLASYETEYAGIW
jgi:hypothetical protein